MTVTSIDSARPRAQALPAGIDPDISLPSTAPNVGPIPSGADPADLFSGLLQAVGDGDKAFAAAQTAENNVIAGHGDIQTMIFERARADAMLQIASGAASHVTQSLNTILQMQV